MTTSKTVRLDDRVIKYIEAYRGDNFSDKLRNYVLEHEERRDQIVDDWNRLQAQVSDKHEEMKMLQDRVRRLREVDARLKPLVDAVLLECKSEVPYVIYSGKRTAVDTPQNAF